MTVGLGYEAFWAIIRDASISRTCCGDCTLGLVDKGSHWAASPAIEMQVDQLTGGFQDRLTPLNGRKGASCRSAVHDPVMDSIMLMDSSQEAAKAV